jgi:hypothetical protein
MTQTLYGFYVSFSGESPDHPISNVYALNTDGETVSTQVPGPGSEPYHGLRGMAFGPDGNFYVAQGKGASVIFQFSGTPAAGVQRRRPRRSLCQQPEHERRDGLLWAEESFTG